MCVDQLRFTLNSAATQDHTNYTLAPSISIRSMVTPRSSPPKSLFVRHQIRMHQAELPSRIVQWLDENQVLKQTEKNSIDKKVPSNNE